MTMLFNSANVSRQLYVLESSADKQGNKLILKAGIRMQRMGKLFRHRQIIIDPTNLLKFSKDLNEHKDNVRGMASALGDVLDWCEMRRKTPHEEGVVTYTRLVEQDWPVMFYCTHTPTRIAVHMYGRDMADACLSFKLTYPLGWKFFKDEMDSIIEVFWDHLDHLEAISFQSITKGLHA